MGFVPTSSLPFSNDHNCYHYYDHLKATSPRKCSLNLGRSCRGNASCRVPSSLLKVEEDVDEACELISGLELSVVEGDDSINTYLLNAVKNNNGTGTSLLSDIFGFEDSSTREFAYRVACNGYKSIFRTS